MQELNLTNFNLRRNHVPPNFPLNPNLAPCFSLAPITSPVLFVAVGGLMPTPSHPKPSPE